MLMQRMMQLLQVKMNGMLLEGEVLSRCAKSVSATRDDEASLESIFDDLHLFKEEEKAGRAKQEGAGDLLSDAEGSVASEGRTEAAMPWQPVCDLRKAHSCAAVQQRCLNVARPLQRSGATGPLQQGSCSTFKRHCAGLAASYTTLS
jgi:hypothetical protein